MVTVFVFIDYLSSFFFFFSSRRRHTRCSRDWSSDVCSSDLEESVHRQILLNRARTPTERLNALCELLDLARAMAPQDPDARERRRRAMAIRQQDRKSVV